MAGREALLVLPVRKEILARFQPEDAPAHPHWREAFQLLLPRLSQALQSKVKLACPLANAPFGGLVELTHEWAAKLLAAIVATESKDQHGLGVIGPVLW